NVEFIGDNTGTATGANYSLNSAGSLGNPNAGTNTTYINNLRSGAGGGSTNPTGVGSANPGTGAPGGATRLAVTVTPGANPTSTGLTVIGDLSSIGGAAAQPFFDDGSNGDVTPNDNIFSFQMTVGGGVASGTKSLPFTVSDALGRTSSAAIAVTV